MLAECRKLYEGGTPNSELGERYGIKASTVAFMAWQRGWNTSGRFKTNPERLRKPDPDPEPPSIDPAVPPGIEEQEFTRRLAVIIQRYWEAQGRPITLEIETMNCGIQCIRSHSINGVPVRVRA